MNRMYKVVWNKVRHCYVVVSEIARRQGGKGAAVGKRQVAAALLAAIALSGLGVGNVWADGTANATDAVSSDYIKVTPGGNGLWNGEVVKAGPAEIKGAISNGKYKDSMTSVAIGNGATIYGTSTNVSRLPGRPGEWASDNVAIGSHSQIGNEKAISANLNERNQGQPEGNVAIGSFAKVSDPTSSNIDEGVAIGMDARVEMSHSVAIGSHAWARKEDLLTADKDGARADSAYGVFSVGTSADVSALPDRELHPGGVGKYTRRIINVSNGQVNDTSTDAVNGSQLFRARELAVKYTAADPNGGTIDKSRVELAGTPYDPANHTGGTTVTNVAGGIEDSDAVNVHQLKSAGWQVTANGENPYLVKKDQTVDFTGASDNKAGTGDHRNITVTKTDKGDGTGTGISFQLDDVLHVGTGNGAHTVVIDGSRGEITGLTNRTWTPYDYTQTAPRPNSLEIEKPVNVYENSGKAATEAQLRQALENLPEGIEITSNPVGGNGWGKEKFKSAPARIKGEGNFRSQNSIAMGNGAVIYGRNDTAQNPDGYYLEIASDNIAIGSFSQVGSEKALKGLNRGQAEGNIAIGTFARVENPNSPNIDEGVAIGMDARVEVSNSVALGSHSRVRKEDLLAVNKDGAVADSAYGVFSVGNSAGMASLPDAAAHPGGVGAYNRRIVNVAKGQINDTSTDAVNGSQLKRLRDLAVKYTAADPNDGPINKNKVSFEGDPYNPANHSGGTTVTNVAYAPHGDPADVGYDGSAAVNMDRLNDSIKAAKDAAASGDRHIKAGEYAVGSVTAGGQPAQGVSMDIVDGTGTATGEKVVITDIAKASDLGDVSQIRPGLANKNGSHTTVVDALNHLGVNVGDIQYKRPDNTATTVVQAGDNVTNAIGKLDAAVGNAAAEAAKHTTVTVNNGKGTGNLVRIVTTPDGKGTNYDIRLNDHVLMGTEAEKQISIDGTTGQISAGRQISLDGAAGRAEIGGISIGHPAGSTEKYITGLTNTSLDLPDFGEAGRAATEEQLKAMKTAAEASDAGNVKYGKKTDGSVDYNSVSLGNGKGTAYDPAGRTGGTAVTNVVYAPGNRTDAGYDGSAAVNMDRLNDSLAAAKTEMAASDKHIKSGEYAVGAITVGGGKQAQGVSMDIIDGAGKATGQKVVITNIAQASDLGDVGRVHDSLRNTDAGGKTVHTTVVDAVNHLDDKVGDTNYAQPGGSPTTVVAAKDNVTTAIGKLDAAFSKASAIAEKHSSVTAGHGISITEGTNAAGGKNYEVGVQDDVTFGKGPAHVAVEGSTGNVAATGAVTAGDVTVNKEGSGVVDGLTNKTWDSRRHDKYKHSGKAATEAQLRGAMEGAVQYDRDIDGNVTNKITLNKNGDTYTTITNVAGGNVEKDSTDAVNGSQLWETHQEIHQNAAGISQLSGSVTRLGNRLNRVGAGAAALAALHPLDFDPDAKWDFSAGYGNYNGANAVAVGAYYRPNEDLMFSVGGSMGGGENMVNAGISVKLGSGASPVNNSKVAMAREIKELRKTVEIQAGQIAQLTALVEGLIGQKPAGTDSRLFPDVPQNHWAYEAVRELAERGYAVGYPDGTFRGDRTLTRYEFAEIIHRALRQGAPDSAVVQALQKEFAPELQYFTVDTIHKDEKGNPTVQRVRVKEMTANG